MKTTLKEFTAKLELRKQLQNNQENLVPSHQGNNNYAKEYTEIKKELEKLENDFFKNLLIPVRFFIGYRMYTEEVYKVGKSYFDGRRKMTQSNGYRSITEIPEITEEMKENMLADMYHY